MRITEFQGTEIELSDAIKQYVQDKLEPVVKLSEGFEPADLAVEVGKTTNHHRKGYVFRCEFNLKIPGTLLRAEAKMQDLYAAIDVAADDLRRQLKKYKGKLRDADRVRVESSIDQNEWTEEE